MTSIIKFTAISGAYDENPLCYLLEVWIHIVLLFPSFSACSCFKVDEFKMLLDCGWNAKFDPKDLENLEPYVLFFVFDILC